MLNADAADRADEGKQQRARQILAGLAEDRSGVISTQVLQELYVTLTRKLGVEPLAAKKVLGELDGFEVVQVTPELIGRTIDTHILEELSFWDALIVAAANASACDELLTEDLNPGQLYAGVRCVNPFG